MRAPPPPPTRSEVGAEGDAPRRDRERAGRAPVSQTPSPADSTGGHRTAEELDRYPSTANEADRPRRANTGDGEAVGEDEEALTGPGGKPPNNSGRLDAVGRAVVAACRALWGEDWVGPAHAALGVNRRTLERLKAAWHTDSEGRASPSWLDELAALMAERIEVLMMARAQCGMARAQVDERSPVDSPHRVRASPFPTQAQLRSGPPRQAPAARGGRG